MSQTIDQIQQTVAYGGPDRVVHWQDFLLDKATKKSAGVQRFQSGFAEFEKATAGLETGEVVVVSGYTKNGKTLFAESWLRSMYSLNAEAKAVIFSFEVQTEKMLAKYISEDKSPQLFVPMELKTMDFDWLLKRCLEAKLKHNCRIVLIDHLHFLVDMETKQNMSLNIGAFMRRLKFEIALSLNLAVILIAHQKQPKEKDSASLSNIRDSSFVAQESDGVIIVSRREDFDDADIKEIAAKRGVLAAAPLQRNWNTPSEEKYSTGLALVKVACHRRTGVFEWVRLYQKRGHFLEEV